MKYGLYSVEAMLNEMYKIGCLKSDIVAKISGGADIMNLNLKIGGTLYLGHSENPQDLIHYVKRVGQNIFVKEKDLR